MNAFTGHRPNHSIRSCFLLFLLILALGTAAARAQTVYQLAGVLTYGGHPMSEFTSVSPTFSAYVGDYQRVYPTVVYIPATGEYQLSGLPAERIFLSVFYILNGSDFTLPGNFEQTEHVTPGELSDSQRLHHNIAVETTMHMTEPWDNNSCQFNTFDTVLIYPPSVLLKWDPVPLADHYRVSVSENRDASHPDGWGLQRTILDQTTTDTYYPLYLPDSRPYLYYLAAIEAYDSLGSKLGSIWITYFNGFGWDYRFKTGTCPAGDINHDCRIDMKDFSVLAANWLCKPPRFEDLTPDVIAAGEAQMGTAHIDASDGKDLNPGSFFIYKTSQGHLGKFIVENLQKDQNNRLTILWQTYNPDGTIFSSGSGLIVRGTYSCDLDGGHEGGSSSEVDFFWSMSTSTRRYLTPGNLAKFQLLYRAP